MFEVGDIVLSFYQSSEYPTVLGGVLRNLVINVGKKYDYLELLVRFWIWIWNFMVPQAQTAISISTLDDICLNIYLWRV